MVGPVAWSGVFALWCILYCTYLDSVLSQSINGGRNDSNYDSRNDNSSSGNSNSNDSTSGQFESGAFAPMTWAQKVRRATSIYSDFLASLCSFIGYI